MTNNAIGIIGGGSWATAIAKTLTDNCTKQVLWWVRSSEVCQALNNTGRNPKHLTTATLDKSRFSAVTDLTAMIKQSALLILAVPSAYIHDTLATIDNRLLKSKKIISAVKGLVPQYRATMSEYLHRTLGIPQENICVMSGPTLAEEVARKSDTYLYMASKNSELATEAKRIMECKYIHVNTTDDVIGLEWSGVLKNIYAIGGGLCKGFYGCDNLMAAYTAAAMYEMECTIEAISPNAHRIFARAAYMGDLMVTCCSDHSRNRTLGIRMAGGEHPAEVVASTDAVPEGYFASQKVHQMLVEERGLKMPIAECIYHSLYGGDAKTETDRIVNEHIQ